MKNACSSSRSKAPRDDALEARLADAEIGAHRRGVLVVELAELGLEPRGDRDRNGALGGGVLGDRGRDRLAALVDVGDEQHRLRRQRLKQLRCVGRVLGNRHRARRAPRVQRLDHRRQPRLLGDGVLVAAARLADDPPVSPLGGLEVREDQLGLDRLDVSSGIDAAVGVDDVLVAMSADDVDDRVSLADVGEELVAEALGMALVCSR